MTAADKRVEELLDRWMASLELHARYLKLDDAAYARVEKWPRHQRPTRWVVDLARKRLLELRAQLGQRKDAGDATFSESLELMSFLTSLVGTEHIERFIPLATGKPPETGVTGTVVQPKLKTAKPRSGAGQSGVHRQLTRSTGTTREVAVLKTPSTTREAARAATPTRDSTRAAVPRSAAQTKASNAQADARVAQVVADAVRLLEWGREWPALAGLIARMADRPAETDVWKILRAHRTTILSKARRPGG